MQNPKRVEYVGLMEKKVKEMGKELNDLRLRELLMRDEIKIKKHKARRAYSRKGDTTCHCDKFNNGTHIMQETIQIICHFPQGLAFAIK